MRLPLLRSNLNACESPHVVVVGAGASRAACPNGDANGRILPLMADLVNVTGLAQVVRSAGLDPDENFELLYQKMNASRDDSVASTVENAIRGYFEALQLPHTATLYDRLLISLRPKDVLATFNWDPLLVQAYQRNRHLKELPRILFLHGNVGIGVCTEHRNKGFLKDRCTTCGQPLVPTRLLYPIGDKNYDQDPFIKSEWDELRGTLESAYILTIIGYAAPDSDAAAKKLMLDAWNANGTRELAQVDLIDVKPPSELEHAWQPFFVRDHYGVATTPDWLFQHARRSCDHFAMATLQLQPCRDTPLPDTDVLARLHEWAIPMIAQEVALRTHVTPLPCG